MKLDQEFSASPSPLSWASTVTEGAFGPTGHIGIDPTPDPKQTPPASPNEPIVGILGGMGPYATLDFMKNIYDLTVAEKDWDHIRLLVDSNCKIPSRTRAIKYAENFQIVVNQIRTCVSTLHAHGAKIIAVPCNSAHAFYYDVGRTEWLNMIRVTSEEVLALGAHKPLILGAYAVRIEQLYSQFIPDAVYTNEESSVALDNLIESIKKFNSVSEEDRAKFNEFIVQTSKTLKTDCVILACTELTKLANHQEGSAIIDSSYVYAKAIVRKVKKKWKERL